MNLHSRVHLLDLLRRRNLEFSSWVESYAIKDWADLLERCKRMGVVPPPVERWDSVVASRQQKLVLAIVVENPTIEEPAPVIVVTTTTSPKKKTVRKQQEEDGTTTSSRDTTETGDLHSPTESTTATIEEQ